MELTRSTSMMRAPRDCILSGVNEDILTFKKAIHSGGI